MFNDLKINSFTARVSSAQDEMRRDGEVMDRLSNKKKSSSSQTNVQTASESFFADPPITSHHQDFLTEANMDEESDTLEDLEFTWKCDESITDTVDFQKEDLIRWLEQPRGNEFCPQQMNCLQGVAYYISQYHSQNELKQDLMNLKEEVAVFPKKDQSRLFSDVLPDMLDLNYENTFETTFAFLRKDFQEGFIKPYTIIAFGEPTGSFHVVVVTKQLKLRSLWVNPENRDESSFGKYEPNVVIDQAERELNSMIVNCPEDSKALGVRPNKCYMSIRFCAE